MNIEIDVPDGVSGPWSVETFEVSDKDLFIHNLRNPRRYILPGKYKALKHNGHVIMSNTPAEIRDHRIFISRASGVVLINGLGLGVALKAILNKPEVTEVTVIEKAPDVIKLVAPTYLGDPRVNIVEADAYEYQPPKGKRYEVIWHDVWPEFCSDNLKEMEKLHRKYGRRCSWQNSWGKEHCQWLKQKQRQYGY